MFSELFGKKNYRNLSQAEAKKKLDSGEPVILLDVRSPEEYAQVHIPGSVSLPLDRLADGISKVASKDSELLIYCQSGMRAATASRLLSSLGYTNINNIGGIQTWKYETEKGRR